uniref:G_PROTEIN_RECEP_F1_2 domain-containing protein n=1 Tax=Globodera pallida TaxID=36090 RepID=A0A183C2P6_GLOPA
MSSSPISDGINSVSDQQDNQTKPRQGEPDDEQQLIVDDAELNAFVRAYCRLCPMGMLRVLNWLLLLTLLIISSLCNWISFYRSYTLQTNVAITLFLITSSCRVASLRLNKGTFKSKVRVGMLAIADLCASLLNVVGQSEDELYFSNDRQRLLSMRMHFIMDPAAAMVASVAILMNIIQMICIWRTFKNANLLLSEYRQHFPHCSKSEAEYAKFLPFGLLKLLQWSIPSSALLLIIASYQYRDSFLQFSFLAAIILTNFFSWLNFIAITRFRTNSNRFEQKRSLLSQCALYIFCAYFFVSIASLVASIAFVFMSNDVKCGHDYLRLPPISIQFSLKVGGKNAFESDTETEKKGGDEKGEEFGKEENVPKRLC